MDKELQHQCRASIGDELHSQLETLRNDFRYTLSARLALTGRGTADALYVIVCRRQATHRLITNGDGGILITNGDGGILTLDIWSWNFYLTLKPLTPFLA
ncbi:hypothetical protein B296_00010796 [Ensete ventricosum]|uniref:Uncharacterized protein n=1 Tax=Ensete ventricosum TaxID=4639 RepID=A0A426XU34_ENSVE|nr:hypothetical protein B296_00010796 [Ensete ventricosum]